MAWLETENSLGVKCQGACAYVKLCDYLKYKIEINEERSDAIKERFDDLLYKRSRAASRMTNYNVQIPNERRSRVLDAFYMAEQEEDMEIPAKEMVNLIQEYKNSEYRRNMYTQLNEMEECGVPGTEIRDFLLMELLVETGGQRPNALINMTVYELRTAKPVTIDNRKVCASVSDVKTRHKHNHAQLIMPRELFYLVLKYLQHVRSEHGSEDVVFVTNNGTKMSNLAKSSALFKKVTGSRFKILPYSFRRVVSTAGQGRWVTNNNHSNNENFSNFWSVVVFKYSYFNSSQDPRTNEKLPEYMGHSKNTARKYYLEMNEKINEHSQILEGVFASAE